MPNSSVPFRIWIAGSNEWLPGPQFNSLEHALASAHKLAANGEVAIELPTRHWHTFPETGEQFLGPAHVEKINAARFAQGSQTNLADRANAALAAPPEEDASSRAYRLSIGKVRTVKRTVPASGRISSTHISTPHTIESTGLEGARETTAPAARAPARDTTIPGHERRDSKRYEAKLVLADPACAIDARRTEILDISESGFRIAVPAGVRINVAGRVVLVFSGRHGCFELTTHACWANGAQAGLHIDKGSGNLVGQMFLRKMISKWIETEKKRKNRRR